MRLGWLPTFCTFNPPAPVTPPPWGGRFFQSTVFQISFHGLQPWIQTSTASTLYLYPSPPEGLGQDGQQRPRQTCASDHPWTAGISCHLSPPSPLGSIFPSRAPPSSRLPKPEMGASPQLRPLPTIVGDVPIRSLATESPVRRMSSDFGVRSSGPSCIGHLTGRNRAL